MRLLLVEDDPMIGKSIHIGLRREGYSVDWVQDGRAGYEVLTPLYLPDGRVALVDRGWLPSSGYRDRLPDISIKAAGVRRLVARVDELPAAGLAAGRAAPSRDSAWPKLTSFPTVAELREALGTELPFGTPASPGPGMLPVLC
ncbi:MAG: SURF1 family cytochrome oxidase biogenesis protein, partial [Burkholderiales bacterium]